MTTLKIFHLSLIVLTISLKGYSQKKSSICDCYSSSGKSGLFVKNDTIINHANTDQRILMHYYNNGKEALNISPKIVTQTYSSQNDTGYYTFFLLNNSANLKVVSVDNFHRTLYTGEGYMDSLNLKHVGVFDSLIITLTYPPRPFLEGGYEKTHVISSISRNNQNVFRFLKVKEPYFTFLQDPACKGCTYLYKKRGKKMFFYENGKLMTIYKKLPVESCSYEWLRFYFPTLYKAWIK